MQNLSDAIAESHANNEIVRVEVPSVPEALADLAVWAGLYEHVGVDNGTDVWGWSKSTPEGQQDWRLLLVE